ncbi:hypothetical protein BDV11DRAFT_211022 [Aspergillus similis]
MRRSPGNNMSLENCLSPQDLVAYLSALPQSQGKLKRFCTFSASIYDCAWLSMIHRRENGQISWLFPECFDYVLSRQLENGSWPSPASTVDGILNTSAALLCLLDRRRLTQNSDLSTIIEAATNALEGLLEAWDLDETDQVGFEVIVPGLLRQISHFGITFTFSGQGRLEALCTAKLEKVCPDMLYSGYQATILHSAESLIGIIDMDQISRHCTEDTGILGSPAATAAYLEHSSQWDGRAESYLRTLLASTDREEGGISSGFPTTVFELAWALSTLFLAVGPPTPSDIALLVPIKQYLQETLAKMDGVAGFAQGILADADDTARVLLTIELLGTEVDFQPMIAHFRTGSFFKTYEHERNPSFSANCNHIDIIEEVAAYLLECWKAGNIKDKWNSSPRYSTMLLALALIRLLLRYDKGDIYGPLQVSLSRDIIICLSQVLSRTLIEQQLDGSWDSSLEVTAYSVLTISRMMLLPCGNRLRNDQVAPAVRRGCGYLIDHQHDPIQPRREDYVWIEKVSYASSLLRKVYTIAAIHASREQLPCTEALATLFQPSPITHELKTLLLSTPLCKESLVPFMDLALLETHHWSHLLRETGSVIFKSPISSDGQKLFHLIPLIFTSCNQRAGLVLSPHTIWNMIHFSLLVYQVDELMESTVIRMADAELDEVLVRLRRSYSLAHPAVQSPQRASNDPSTLTAGVRPDDLKAAPLNQSRVEDLMHLLHPFIKHVLGHPQVLQSPAEIQNEIAEELYRFLSAHIEHIRANISLRTLGNSAPADNGSRQPHKLTYYHWVHFIGSADTSCTLASLFFLCLISEPGKFCFQHPKAQYLSRTVTHHLSVMCRQYNDYGSAVRDREEGNLNSLDFFEIQQEAQAGTAASELRMSNGVSSFVSGTQPFPQPACLSPSANGSLIEIAEFERSCMELALQRLEDTPGTLDALKRFRVFVDVTDLFGQVYVLKDLTGRVRPAA